MKKFGVALLIVILVPLGVVLVPLVWIGGGMIVGDWRVKAFYVGHPFMDDMVRAGRSDPKKSWSLMTDFLLERVPISTSRSEATRILSSGGLRCGPPNVHTTMLIVCHPIGAPESAGRWWIELSLNSDDSVSGGRVMRFK